ncbi:glucokinase [Tundrisphaera sp. TA3]|uniref:glucokinase n=1 Tax=Tundrisphaera sp. TA3 TaxID=3435775 RepID=UPI003EBB1467
MILAGDIGGTKTTLALFEIVGPKLRATEHVATFPSGEHATFGEILSAFLAEIPAGTTIDACCLGVAGAVLDGRVETTNLPWEIDEPSLAEAVGAPRATLLNDLEATAYGMIHLDLGELHVLNTGTSRRRRGNVAVIAAGTGLGEATLFWDGRHFQPIASEGGHSDFAPRNPREVELLQYLWTKFGGHASYERVLSGAGIVNLYEFLRVSGNAPEPSWLSDRFAEADDPAIVISQAGLKGEDANCVAALDMFAEIYGAEAGNLALNCLAVGGVFVGGGIAPKLLDALTNNDAFMRGFTAKGRFSEFMERFHVSVSLNPRAALLGAAYYAIEP